MTLDQILAMLFGIVLAGFDHCVLHFFWKSVPAVAVDRNGSRERAARVEAIVSVVR
jgi:hypothetical protein